MENNNITNLYKQIVSSFSIDDISYSDESGEWFCAISVHFKYAERYFENFKNADPFSVLSSWNTRIYDYLKEQKPFKICLNGNIVTAVFRTPKKSDIDGVVYYAAYISSLKDLYNAILEKKGIKTFDVGIGISTSESRLNNIKDSSSSTFTHNVDLKSIVLSLNASADGLEPILVDNCTQFNLSELICYDNKKYKDVGVCHNNVHFCQTVYGYSLNVTGFAEWINEHCKTEK